MSTLRYEIEQLLGLKFPEKNGEALIDFEESLEIPAAAEMLMRGYYKNAESVKRGFQSLYQEISNVIELLLPKRAKLREWANELPQRPMDAEQFLIDTATKLEKHEKRRQQVERELIKELRENTVNDIFPLPLASFGVVMPQERAVKIFLKPIGRLAEMLGVNPEQMRRVVRIHFLIQLLIYIGIDLDGQTCMRTGNEETVQSIATAYTMRYLQFQSKELAQNYQEWLKTWGGKPVNWEIVNEQCLEKARAAVIAWRRHSALGWEQCWAWAEQIGKRELFSPTAGEDKGMSIHSTRFYDV